MKRCPFCNSDKLENLQRAKYGGQVHCAGCGARGPIPDQLQRKLGKDVEDGFIAWNCRAISNPKK